MLSQRQEEEAVKLDTLEKVGKERQESLLFEIQQKKQALEAKEQEIEDIKMAKSVTNSQPKSISKVQTGNKDISSKIKTPSRKSGKNSNYNSWMESDEESAASSLRRDDSDHSKSRIHDSSFNSKQTPKQFVNEKTNQQNADNQDQFADELSESSKESPVRPNRQVNQTNNKPYGDKQTNISNRKNGIPFSNSNRHIADNTKRDSNWRNQTSNQGANTGNNSGNNRHDKGKMTMYRMDSREAIQEDNNEQDYNEKYKTIKYYDDYYNKYKTNVKRKFEMIDEHEYVKKGQDQVNPKNESQKNVEEVDDVSLRQKKRKRRKREFWDVNLDAVGNKNINKQDDHSKNKDLDSYKDDSIEFVGGQKSNNIPKQSRVELDPTVYKTSEKPIQNQQSNNPVTDSLRGSTNRGRVFQLQAQERSRYTKPSR